VKEGGEALLQLKLSANTYGSLMVSAHATAVNAPDGADLPIAPFTIDVADGQTTVDVRIPIEDDAVDEPTQYFTITVDALDAIPYRFADGGNLVTVLDNDGPAPTDHVAPVVAPHRNVIVDRSGGRPAWVPFSPPTATDDVDGSLPAVCSPAPMSLMPMGRTQVKCSSTDAAGNTASSAFQVTVRTPKTNGVARPIGGDHRCVASGEYAWIEAEGFTANSTVTVQLQSSTLQVTKLQTVRADHKGRVRLVVRIPATTAGDADVVLLGQAGNDDLVRMLPIEIGLGGHKHGGKAMSYLRNRNCD
ncbi:MAG TPA: HYR domain-containing protein, partial [Ilumatobacteraceae bacterium]